MDQRYDEADPDHSADALDEYLCEYVDGSMDPVVKEAFEEYLAANPELAEHVACLCRTRNLLAHSCACSVSSERLKERLHLEIARDLMGESDGASNWALPRLGSLATLTSSLCLMVLLGMVFGTALVEERSPRAWAADRPAIAAPSDAHGIRTAGLSSAQAQTASWGLPAPRQSLPVVLPSRAMTPISSSAISRPQPAGLVGR